MTISTLIYEDCFSSWQVFFDDHINEETYCGNVFGLGNSYSGNGYTLTDASQ